MAGRRAGSESIEITDRFRPRTDRRFVRHVIVTTLEWAQRSELCVSLLLAGNREIRAIHRDYLDDPSNTDVITFVIDDTIELAVNVELARREARRRGHTIRAELSLYIVHGILHACGHDDRTARDRDAMRAAEREVLELLGQTIDRFE